MFHRLEGLQPNPQPLPPKSAIIDLVIILSTNPVDPS